VNAVSSADGGRVLELQRAAPEDGKQGFEALMNEGGGFLDLQA